MYIILEGNKSTIAGIIGIIESLNSGQNLDITHASSQKGESGSITIYFKEAEHIWILAGAAALFMKETLKPVVAQLLEK